MAKPKAAVIHMTLLGLLLAALFFLSLGPPVAESDRTRVVITDADVAHVRAKWMRTWNRPPTSEELQGALHRYVREEILYREALAMGLDRGDPTVKLALVRKLSMMASGVADQREISDEEIAAYFALRKERYRIPQRTSLRQVFVNRDQRGEAAEDHAREVLATLREREPQPQELSDFGDPLMLDQSFQDATDQDLARTFGGPFVDAVSALPPGEWQGPVESGYGLHLVQVIDREASRIPEWQQVRERILEDMRYEARRAAEDQFFQEVASGYRVSYDGDAAAVLSFEGRKE
jgi:peptidyl-prolyl cis-trans isomerase C